jgi:putative flavoprotein involved in K+ transport
VSGTASRSDVIIIGGGQAGVSLAYYLSQCNLSHVVLERDRPFASWRGRWDGFRANTPNWMNTLPMLDQRRMPRAEADEFASRDELVRYLDECLRVVDPPLVLGADVTSVREVEGGWEVRAADRSYRADNVAVCTGAMNTPRVPAAARQLPTHIRTLHSSEYVSPEQITTANVLVVGSASSGMQILRLLAETGRFGGGLHLATSRVLVLPKHVAGVPIHRVVNAFGLFDVRTRSPLGKMMYSGLETRGDPIMPPTPKQLARQYGVQLYGKLTGFDASGLRFADGQTLAPDDLTVIWCTGFRSDYAYIEPLDRSAAFDADGLPLHVRGVVEGAPGLYFVGLRYQHTSASHDIYGVGQDARYVAEHIQRRAVRGQQGGDHDRRRGPDRLPQTAP